MAIRTRTLALLVSSQIGSAMGSSISAFGASIWVFQETGSTTLLALVFLASLAPGALIGTVAGATVDRYDRRRVMLVADSVAGLATLVAVVLLGLGVLAWWHLALVAAAISTTAAYQEPAYSAALPTLATRETLSRVNGAVQIGPALALIVGPAVGGALVATVGLGAAFAVDLLTFVVAVAVLSRVRFDPTVDTSTSSMQTSPLVEGGTASQIREGWRELRRRPGLLLLTVLAGGVNFLFGFVNVLLLPLLLGFTDEASAGMAFGAAGVGMLAGSLVMATWRGPRSHVTVIALGITALGVATTLMALRPSVVLIAVALALVMASVPVVSTAGKTLAQLAVDDRVRGRVFGIRRAIATAAMPVSYLLAGPLAEGVFEPAMRSGGWLADVLGPVVGIGSGRGIAALFLMCGAGVAVVGLLIGRSRSLRRLEEELDTAPVPEPAGAPLPA